MARRSGGELVLLWIHSLVPLSMQQPLLPLSLPVHMAVIPPSWHLLPLSQVELGPLFSNSSPFSSPHCVFMLPPPGPAPEPRLQASFGPYSATQLPAEPVSPAAALLSVSLLSQNVERERDLEGGESFRVRALFHQRGDASRHGTCVTLHAFQETQEHKKSCITQPPLGVCSISLTLPSDWFHWEYASQSQLGLDEWYGKQHPGRRAQRRRRHRHGNLVSHQHSSPPLRSREGNKQGPQADSLRASRYQRSPKKTPIQLYYSSFRAEAEPQLKPTGCLQGGPAQSQNQLFYIQAVTLRDQQGETRTERSWTLKQEHVCLNKQEEEELSVDSHVAVFYHRGPVLIGESIKVSVNLRANFSAQLAVIRVRVKKGLVSMVAQRTLTSDLWAVTLERSQDSKHDVVSIFCHKHKTPTPYHNPALMQQVVCLSMDGLKRSFGVAMTVSAEWWVEYSGHRNTLPPHGAIVSFFSFTDRQIFGITPITERNTIINTAILTNKPVSLPVTVLAISHDEKMSDVTSAVTCHSANEDTVKVSSDCSTLFVDGSESGLGSTCAVVEFQLGSLQGSVCLDVWVPSVPLRVSLTDPLLNAIQGWNLFTEKGCVPVYQRSTVQVLTQFTAQDLLSTTTHLLGSSDWFMDVTELVHDWLRIENPQVASLNPQKVVIGLKPGKTSLRVVSEQWDGVLGKCDITVTSDPVSLGDLSVQVVSGLGMSVTHSPAHPFIVMATVTAYNILYDHYQEASISVWLQFDDNTASLLSTFNDLPFFLRLSSLAESVVLVTPSPEQRIVAQGDGGGPLVRAELLVSTCAPHSISSNSIREDDGEWLVSNGGGEGGGGSTRVLARGSGWIRVNLDLDSLHPIGRKDGESEEFEFDISDMLVESDSDLYRSAEDGWSGNVSTATDYDEIIVTQRRGNKVGNQGTFHLNTLERAVLIPSREEGTVYFSPSQERGGQRGEEKEQDRQTVEELEFGLAAVLSLLCLSAVLFLVNCLPCALQDRRRRTKTKKEQEGEKEEENDEVEDNEVKEKVNSQRLKPKLEDETEEVFEVEIIC